MSTWRYKRINVFDELERISLEPEFEPLVDVDIHEYVLNEYGMDGWELVCVTVLPNGKEYAYMKQANNL